MKIAVIGAGSWGTALASVLVWNGHDVSLWARNPRVVQEIQEDHTNRKYLADATLPAIDATTDIGQAISGAELVLLALPSASVEDVLRDAKPYISSKALLVHAIKGFDATGKRISERIMQHLNTAPDRVCVIAGPSHAEEVIAQMPTTVVVAAYSRTAAESVQDALMNRALRVYTNPDVVGAELGGALKNIIALGVGIADGLGFGDNAKAALMTRGLAEITRLGIALGASPLTFAGLSGVGDLVVTCTSRHSRNFRTGRLIGQGASLEAAMAKVGMAVEGVRTACVARQIARDRCVEMPITESIYSVLFEQKPPSIAVEDLMGRARNHEIEEVARQDMSPYWIWQ